MGVVGKVNAPTPGIVVAVGLILAWFAGLANYFLPFLDIQPATW
jgi:hypothetical protein